MVVARMQDLIDEVMDNFDFTRVHEVMSTLGWTWAYIHGVPDERDLRKTARLLLKGAFETGYNATGGLKATYRDDELSLSFEVTEWGAFVDDNGEVLSS